jgi:hypothetical protein
VMNPWNNGSWKGMALHLAEKVSFRIRASL